MPADTSPFTPGNPVPTELFVGRKSQLEEILQYVERSKKGKQENIFLTGERGIGKSSLAKYIREIATIKENYLSIHVLLGGVNSVDGVIFKNVIVQHPMKNAQFDIYLNTSDGCVYNRQIGITETKLFKFTGTGSIQGADAAEALIQALQEPNVDDAYANLTFTIRNGSNPASISLYQGWNFISTPKKLSSGNNTATIFSSIDTAGHSIYLYNASEQRWHAMTLNDEVQPLDGIWLYANTTADVDLSFDTNPMQTPPTKFLSAGWNAIGFTDTTSISASTTLNSVKAKWSTLIGFTAPQQRYDAAIVNGATDPTHGDQQMMYPEKGYWLYMTEAGELAAIGA